MSTSWDLRSLVDTSLGLVIVCFVFLFLIGSILIPIGNVLRRTGHSPLWSAFFLIPGATRPLDLRPQTLAHGQAQSLTIVARQAVTILQDLPVRVASLCSVRLI